MKENLLESLRQAIATKPNDRHAHTELAAFIRRQVPEAKPEVDAIMNERYNPTSPPSNLKQWVHPRLRENAPQKKNIVGLGEGVAEAVSPAAMSDGAAVIKVPSTTKVKKQPAPEQMEPGIEIDPEKIAAMNVEEFLDFFGTKKAIKQYAISIGVKNPADDNFALFDQIRGILTTSTGKLF